jgi:hypothetical protein
VVGTRVLGFIALVVGLGLAGAMDHFSINSPLRTRSIENDDLDFTERVVKQHTDVNPRELCTGRVRYSGIRIRDSWNQYPNFPQRYLRSFEPSCAAMPQKSGCSEGLENE